MLTPQLFRKLLAVAGERRNAYLLAAGTGLRRDELGKLAWGDVHLTGPRPYIRLQVKNNKARRPDEIDLSPEMVETLRAIPRQNAIPTVRVLEGLPIPSVDEMRADSAAAGIPFEDELKRRVDFHSLRKTHNMLLAVSGVDIRTAMKMMRVTDPKLVTDVYADLNLLDTGAAAKKLPRLDGPDSDKDKGSAAG